MVVLRVSPRAVRVQFDKEFHPNCLQNTLKSELTMYLYPDGQTDEQR
jgi:hypothetical protein